MHRVPVGLLLVLATLASCGTAAGPGYDPPVLTLHGAITRSDVPTPATVRLALLWKRRPPEGTTLGVAQELSVRAEFPVSFEASVSALPPEEAMTPGPAGSGYRFAVGTVLAYDDRNGNGKLDLAPLDGTPDADVILGAPERLSVYYLEGTPGSDLPAGVKPGFNLWVEPALSDPTPPAAVCGPTADGPVQILRPDSDVSIALTASPALTRLICEDRPETAPNAGPLGQPMTYQATCSPDGTSYVLERCTDPAGLCHQAWCYYQCGSLPPGGTKPAGWPCP